MPFNAAARAFAALADLRRRRTRHLNYTFGRQWLDTVHDPSSGRFLTEAELARKSGRTPQTNNLVRQLVKTVVGRFRYRLQNIGTGDKPADPRLRRIAGDNLLDEMDCRMLEEFLISGCAIQRVTSERRPAGEGVWVDNVDPSRFFVNSFTDPRGHDIELLGMTHDMSFRELAARFAPEGGRSVERLRIIYNGCAPGPFGVAPDGRCRAIEVWSLDAAPIARRLDPDTGAVDESPCPPYAEAGPLTTLDTRLTWQCRWYAPDGSLLTEYPSPWAHASHPFVIKFYPLTGGEIHSLVEDVIDQQRSVNRLITLIDHVIGTSAKGALLFPADQVYEGQNIEEVAEQWARPDGVILYRPNNASSRAPEQLISGREPSSAYHLLDLEMRLMQQTSGVSEALAGHVSSDTARSAALYEARMTAADIALLDTYAAFDAFRRARDAKILGM